MANKVDICIQLFLIFPHARVTAAMPLGLRLWVHEHPFACFQIIQTSFWKDPFWEGPLRITSKPSNQEHIFLETSILKGKHPQTTPDKKQQPSPDSYLTNRISKITVTLSTTNQYQLNTYVPDASSISLEYVRQWYASLWLSGADENWLSNENWYYE